MEGGEETSRSRCYRDGSEAHPEMTQAEGTCPKKYKKPKTKFSARVKIILLRFTGLSRYDSHFPLERKLFYLQRKSFLTIAKCEFCGIKLEPLCTGFKAVKKFRGVLIDQAYFRLLSCWHIFNNSWRKFINSISMCLIRMVTQAIFCQ